MACDKLCHLKAVCTAEVFLDGGASVQLGMGSGVMSEMLDMLWSLFKNCMAAAAVLVIGRIVAKMIRGLIEKLMTSAKQEQTLISFVSHLSYAALMAFVIVNALAQLGVDTASFVMILGAAGLAIGLALQGSLSKKLHGSCGGTRYWSHRGEDDKGAY